MHFDELEVIQRGRRARRLLEDEDIQQGFADVERELFRLWTCNASPIQREELHADMRALSRIRYELQSWADELTKRGIE